MAHDQINSVSKPDSLANIDPWNDNGYTAKYWTIKRQIKSHHIKSSKYEEKELSDVHVNLYATNRSSLYNHFSFQMI